MPKEGSKYGKSAKTTKTARVLSLLTDPAIVGEDETRSGESMAAAESETAAQIRDALEAELAAGTPPLPRETPVSAPEPSASAPEPSVPAPRPDAKPVTLEEFPVPEDAVVLSAAEPEPVLAPEPEPAAEPEPVSAPEPEPAPEESEEDDDEHYTCLNVTQALVEEKAEKYIKMFGMCTCRRCRIDVIAIAMSNLPAKYVVVKDKDINPRLSMYEARYNSAVVTQVMSACKKVTERPHHVR